jgi:ABC-2 type transport system ATP-binding protein
MATVHKVGSGAPAPVAATVPPRPAAAPQAVPAPRRRTGKALIEVEGLVKVYGGHGRRQTDSVRAVDGVSFTVEEGEFFGFLGPNGSGKSTTIKIITTLLAKTSGTVRVGGLDVEKDSEALRRLIGYTGQSIGVDGELTGRENLTLIGHLYKLPRALVEERVKELLEVLQLTEAADRLAYTYSGGMRRRLDLGSGLMHRPRLLFLDEPTTGLDPQTRAAVWDYLARLHREEGMTIFLTTQYMDEADRLCERLAIIDKGRIVAEGSPAQLKASIGGDVVTVRIARDERFQAVQARVVAVARATRGVRDVLPFDEGVSVHAEDGSATLLELLRRLDAERVTVQQVAMAHPTLDEVFLQVTGRQMRVEEVKPMSRMGGPGQRRR